MKFVLVVLGLCIAVLTAEAKINDVELRDSIDKRELREALIKALEENLVNDEDDEPKNDVTLANDEGEEENDEGEELKLVEVLNDLQEKNKLKDPLFIPRIRIPRIRIPRIRIPRVRIPRVRFPRIRFGKK